MTKVGASYHFLVVFLAVANVVISFSRIGRCQAVSWPPEAAHMTLPRCPCSAGMLKSSLVHTLNLDCDSYFRPECNLVVSWLIQRTASLARTSGLFVQLIGPRRKLDQCAFARTQVLAACAKPGMASALWEPS